MQGFDGRKTDFAAGSVTGVRWWELRNDPLRLTGVQGVPWWPGENTARCLSKRHRFHDVPAEKCGCGFWAYWEIPSETNPHAFMMPVLGVVEGYGLTLIGDRGFRCAKARIRALHLPDWETGWPAQPGVRFRTILATETWRELCGKPQSGKEEISAVIAALECLLEDHYRVPVYSTQSLLLASHPPTRDYLPRSRPGRIW